MAVRYEEPHPGPRRNPILSFVREHFTVVGSGIAALIFAIRLLFGVWPLLRGDIYICCVDPFSTDVPGGCDSSTLILRAPGGAVHTYYRARYSHWDVHAPS